MSDDVIRIMCPKLTCRRILAVPVEARGRTVRCKGCATVIRVPLKSQPVAEAPAAPAPEADKGKAPEKGADGKGQQPKAA